MSPPPPHPRCFRHYLYASLSSSAASFSQGSPASVLHPSNDSRRVSELYFSSPLRPLLSLNYGIMRSVSPGGVSHPVCFWKKVQRVTAAAQADGNNLCLFSVSQVQLQDFGPTEAGQRNASRSVTLLPLQEVVFKKNRAKILPLPAVSFIFDTFSRHSYLYTKSHTFNANRLHWR